MQPALASICPSAPAFALHRPAQPQACPPGPPLHAAVTQPAWAPHSPQPGSVPLTWCRRCAPRGFSCWGRKEQLGRWTALGSELPVAWPGRRVGAPRALGPQRAPRPAPGGSLGSGVPTCLRGVPTSQLKMPGPLRHRFGKDCACDRGMSPRPPPLPLFLEGPWRWQDREPLLRGLVCSMGLGGARGTW